MRTDYNHKKKSPKNKFWNFSIWNKLNQTMVRERGLVPALLAPDSLRSCRSAKQGKLGQPLAILDLRFKPFQTKIKTPASTGALMLVHLCDLSWNQIVPSLRLMQSKLIDLGFEYYNGNIVINETETEGSQYHA